MCALLHVDSVVCLLVRSLLLPLLMDWQVNFSWSFTLETLLASELSELERLLATRQEMLAMMRPLSCGRVARMMGLTGPGAGDSGAGGAVGSHITGSSLAGWSELDMAATEGTTASPAAGLFKEKEDEDEDEDIKEATYSAKAARAGKDIGKPGKAFAKIAKSAAKRYGSMERGKKVAGAVLAKLRAKMG